MANFEVRIYGIELDKYKDGLSNEEFTEFAEEEGYVFSMETFLMISGNVFEKCIWRAFLIAVDNAELPPISLNKNITIIEAQRVIREFNGDEQVLYIELRGNK